MVCLAYVLGLAVPCAAQDSPGWQFMSDGALFAVVNHQGGPRGADEVPVTNWWMGMPIRPIGSTQFRFNTMFSLEPVTAGASGYAELFQVGEALHGRPLIDRQHPHDFLMQLAAVWRIPIGDAAGFTIAGGPVGEPALGPVAFLNAGLAAAWPFAYFAHSLF